MRGAHPSSTRSLTSPQMLWYKPPGATVREWLSNLSTEEEYQEALKKTWLCIFAINGHRSICGTKWNPCAWGCPKYLSSDPKYEIDKFDDVVAEVEGLVVSLDEELQALTRIWVVAEIAEGIQSKPIKFQFSDSISNGVAEKLLGKSHFLVSGGMIQKQWCHR